MRARQTGHSMGLLTMLSIAADDAHPMAWFPPTKLAHQKWRRTLGGPLRHWDGAPDLPFCVVQQCSSRPNLASPAPRGDAKGCMLHLLSGKTSYTTYGSGLALCDPRNAVLV
jgi:hypothetical protein